MAEIFARLLYTHNGPVMKLAFKFAFPAVILLLPFFSARASEIRAFHNINQLPFKQIFGLPSLDNCPLTEVGQLRATLISNISNTFDNSTGTNDTIETDVETLRTSLTVSYAVRDNWQLGIEVPYVRHSSGFLDDFIYDWHDFFSIEQNGRTKYSSDQIRINYFSTNGASFTLSESSGDIGDIRINSTYTLPWENRSLIFSTELKLPTGDFDKLTGSGGLDISAGLTVNDSYSLEKFNITVFGGLAGVYLGDIESDLAVNQNNFVLAGRAGIGWQASRLIQLKLQVDGQTPLYDSDIKEMGDPALQLVMGTSFTFSDEAYIDISIAEDINTSTAADVAIQLAVVITY
jgi:hypothetical protein